MRESSGWDQTTTRTRILDRTCNCAVGARGAPCPVWLCHARTGQTLKFRCWNAKAAVSIRGRGQHERRVAGSGVTQQPVFQIHKEISGGDEVLLELAAESHVQAGENARGIIRVRRLSRKRDLEH